MREDPKITRYTAVQGSVRHFSRRGESLLEIRGAHRLYSDDLVKYLRQKSEGKSRTVCRQYSKKDLAPSFQNIVKNAIVKRESGVKSEL